jgi:hypothetical protein
MDLKDCGDVAGNVHPITCHEGTDRELTYSCTLSLISALDGRGWLTPSPGRFSPGNDTVSTVQEAGWAPGPVWTGTENVASHRDSMAGPSRP